MNTTPDTNGPEYKLAEFISKTLWPTFRFCGDDAEEFDGKLLAAIPSIVEETRKLFPLAPAVDAEGKTLGQVAFEAHPSRRGNWVDMLDTGCHAWQAVGNAVESAALAHFKPLDERDTLGYKEAASLAMSMWKQHYRHDSPDFELLDTTAGVISQIDNMAAGLRSMMEEAKAKVKSIDLPDPGEGYRLLRKGATPETVQKGDELYRGGWHPSENAGLRQSDGTFYRRKIDPSPVAGGELSEEQRERIVVEALDFWSNHKMASIRDVLEYAIAKVPSVCAAPTIYKTQDRKPTEADANAERLVLAYRLDLQAWRIKEFPIVCQEPETFPNWTSLPPDPIAPPVDEEEQARTSAYEKRFADFGNPPSGTEIGTFNAAWEAAKDFFTKNTEEE